MAVDFDKVVDRRGVGSKKWQKYEKDVIPRK